MKHIGGLLGFITVAYIATIITEQCKSETLSPTANLDGKPVRRNITKHDEEDHFVPYQGSRSDFDWKLLKTMSKNNSGNVLLSPISLKLALVLLYEGSQGDTQRELINAMQLSATPERTRDTFSSILQSLQTPSPDYKLNIGTRIYIDSNITTRQQYKSIIETYYSTNVISANLSDTHSVVANVNAWVSNITDGNIDRMIEDEDRVKDSVMLIMNAFFFKGSWRRKYFSPENTQIRQFYTSNNQTVKVPFMNAAGEFYYYESPTLDAKILRIPYHGKKFAMYLLLPNTWNGIEQLINNTNSRMLENSWNVRTVDVSIPKFKLNLSNQLEHTLRELGIRDIFDDTATFTNITHTKRDSKRLRVSNILQKVGIEVNENGTTAYAATEIELGNKIMSDSFHANRPFLFYIEDESTGTILHMGKVTNPLDGQTTAAVVETELSSKINTDSNLQTVLTSRDRNNLFNAYFSQNLYKEYNGNVISSPASIKTALTMLMEGAGGHTKTELISVLRLPEGESLIRDVIRHTLMSLKRNENGTEVDLATCLWVDKNLPVLDDYKQILQSYYEADIQNINFMDSKNAVQHINNWVQRATRNKISSSLTNIESDVRLMLTSAVYFKGRWMKAFDKARTRLQCFYMPNNECKDIHFMILESTYRYVRMPSIEAQVLEIPYSDGKTSMLTIMPIQHKRDPYLRILSKDLATVSISTILANLRERDVTIHLPKFTIESNLNLIPTLEDLDIKSIFRSDANLTKIITNGFLQVTSILQNVKIEVDEEGTVAAANTEIGIHLLSASNGEEVKLDRPFLFLIIDSVTQSILFSGRFIEPI